MTITTLGMRLTRLSCGDDRGKVPALVRELIKDTRRMMAPYTALKLKERKSNSLKDYLALSGTLGVSHLICFSTTETGTYLRLAKMPRGPTLYFKLESYCLCKDVAASQKRPHSPGTEYLTSPLVVLNNMQSDQRHIKLTDVMIQNMFPAIDVDTMKLQECRRVVLFRRDPETQQFDLRHYVVNVKAAGLTKAVRKILRRPKLPNLSKFQDVADYVMGDGGASDSEADDIEDSRFEVQAGHKAIQGQRGARPSKEAEDAAVKLIEVGPRMRLSLLKIEDGFCDGEVLYHAHISKDPEEAAVCARVGVRARKLVACAGLWARFCSRAMFCAGGLAALNNRTICMYCVANTGTTGRDEPAQGGEAGAKRAAARKCQQEEAPACVDHASGRRRRR